MNKKQEEALVKEWQDFFTKFIKKQDDKSKQSPTKQAENSQAQETSGTIEFFDSFYINIIQVKISQAIIINQNTIQSAENLPKGQENDNGRTSRGEPTSTPNSTRENTNNATTPPIPTNATTMQDDDKEQGDNRNAKQRAAENTARFANSGGYSQNERAFNDNRGSDTNKSASTAVGEGLKEFKTIYGIEIQTNEAELKELERKVLEWKGLFSYSPSTAQSELDKFLQENIQEFRKNEGRYLESSKYKLYANFAVAIRVCQILNYEPSREKTEEIKKILGVKKLKVNAI